MDISVIIPIYNVEKYLRRCVDSVLRQDHSNIKCLHIKNSGPATAKNKGYDISQGTYVAFIDSDDEIKPDMFYLMLQSGYKHNADIICCNYIQIDEEGHFSHTKHTGKEYVLNQDEAIKAILIKDKIYSQCWTKIYKHEMLESNHIMNTDGLKTDEDFIYNIQAFACSHTVCIVDKPLYIYTHRNKSLSKDYYRNHINQYIDRKEARRKHHRQKIPPLEKIQYLSLYLLL